MVLMFFSIPFFLDVLSSGPLLDPLGDSLPSSIPFSFKSPSSPRRSFLVSPVKGLAPPTAPGTALGSYPCSSIPGRTIQETFPLPPHYSPTHDPPYGLSQTLPQASPRKTRSSRFFSPPFSRLSVENPLRFPGLLLRGTALLFPSESWRIPPQPSRGSPPQSFLFWKRNFGPVLLVQLWFINTTFLASLFSNFPFPSQGFIFPPGELFPSSFFPQTYPRLTLVKGSSLPIFTNNFFFFFR